MWLVSDSLVDLLLPQLNLFCWWSLLLLSNTRLSSAQLSQQLTWYFIKNSVLITYEMLWDAIQLITFNRSLLFFLSNTRLVFRHSGLVFISSWLDLSSIYYEFSLDYLYMLTLLTWAPYFGGYCIRDAIQLISISQWGLYKFPLRRAFLAESIHHRFPVLKNKCVIKNHLLVLVQEGRNALIVDSCVRHQEQREWKLKDKFPVQLVRMVKLEIASKGEKNENEHDKWRTYFLLENCIVQQKPKFRFNIWYKFWCDVLDRIFIEVVRLTFQRDAKWLHFLSNRFLLIPLHFFVLQVVWPTFKHPSQTFLINLLLQSERCRSTSQGSDYSYHWHFPYICSFMSTVYNPRLSRLISSRDFDRNSSH